MSRRHDWNMRVISLMALIFLLIPTQTFAHSKPADIERIQKRGKLVVAMYAVDSPPFFMHDKNGKLFGFDVDLARDIAENLGVDVEFNRSAKTFNSVVDLVAEGKADVAISKLSKTSSRALRVVFTDIYATLDQVLLVNRLNMAQLKRGTNPLTALNTKEVQLAVAAGTAYEGFAKRDFKNATLVALVDRFAAMKDLNNGKLHAMLLDESTVQNWFHKEPEVAIRVRTVIRNNRIDPVAMAVHSNDHHLLTWLNSYLEIISLDGTAEGLKRTYLDDDEWRSRLK